MKIFLGLHCDGFNRFPKMNVIQQASFVSINRAPTSVTPCVIPTCQGHPGCHPSDKLQNPCYDTPVLTPFCRPKHSQIPQFVRESNETQIPHFFRELNETQMPQFIRAPNQTQTPQFICERNPYKLGLDSGPKKSEIPKIVCEHKDEKPPDPCQCSPEKIREMFEQVLRGKPPNLKTTGCGGGMDTPPSVSPINLPASPPTNQATCKHQPMSIKPALKPVRDLGKFFI